VTVATVAEIRQALAETFDPEYPVGLVDLGLVRGVELAGTTARVQIAYCSLGCPCIQLIESDIEERLLQLDGVERVEVHEVFEPWTRRDISVKGLRILREAGVG
jgi:metal-sulfur cluster biosynthetic enzyme